MLGLEIGDLESALVAARKEVEAKTKTRDAAVRLGNKAAIFLIGNTYALKTKVVLSLGVISILLSDCLVIVVCEY